MPHTKLSALTFQTGALVDVLNDHLNIDDVSAGISKRITPSELEVALNTAGATVVTNVLAAPVTLASNTLAYTGPSCAQGSSGTWFATGNVTMVDSVAGEQFLVKLTDGTNTKAAHIAQSPGAGLFSSVGISGVFASPPGNIRITVQPVSHSGTGSIINTATGLSKDSVLTVVRLK